MNILFIYNYKSSNRELQIRPIYECRFDERLKTKAKELKRLAYTGLLGGLEHLSLVLLLNFCSVGRHFPVAVISEIFFSLFPKFVMCARLIFKTSY